MNIVHCGLCYTLLQLNESSVLQVNPHGSILEPWHNKPWTGKWSRKWGALYMTEIIRHLWNISWTIGMLFKLFYYGTICIKRCKPSSGWSDFISTQFTVYSQLLNTHKQNLGVSLARVDRTLFPRNLQSILNSSTHINKIWVERVLAARQRNAIIQRKVNQLT